MINLGLIGTQAVNETAANETIFFEAIGESVTSHPVIIGIGALIMVFFTFMMFKDFFSRIFGIIIGIIFLQLLVTGEFKRMTGIIVFFFALSLFLARFTLWLFGGWETKEGTKQIGLIDYAFKVKDPLRVTFDILTKIADAFYAAWVTTFGKAEEVVETYFKWK